VQYDSSLNIISRISFTSQPLQPNVVTDVLIDNEKIYIAFDERDYVQNKSISTGIYIYNKSDLSYNTTIDIDTSMYIDNFASFADMHIFEDDIYIISSLEKNDRPCILKINLTDYTKSYIIVNSDSVGNLHGLYVNQDKIYLVTLSSGLIVIDFSGNIINYWPFSSPLGFSGSYSEIIYHNNKFYIMSENRGTGDTARAHILIYEEYQ